MKLNLCLKTKIGHLNEINIVMFMTRALIIKNICV